MFRTLTALSLLALAACKTDPVETAEPAEPVPELAPLWVSSGFDAPEGVALAPDGGYFISNVGGDADVRDGDGHVTKIAADGTIEKREFAVILDAPKGMAVLDGQLYVADIDEVVMYDAETGMRTGRIAPKGAAFLNDMAVWDGTVYVSDSGTATIYRVAGGKAEIWLQDPRLGGVNGLLPDGDRMLIATMETGTLFSASASGDLTAIASGMTDADGIGLVPGGGYLVSSWPGQIHHVSPRGKVTTLLDTTEAGILQNDLTVIGDTVIVPNWVPGTVTAWKIVR